MGNTVLMKGNRVVAEAAIKAGCRYFFGYPITPSSEIAEYMSALLPEVGSEFVQSESEVAAINMVAGASSAGGRVMTASSGPGLSLMQEGLSYMAAAELPAVVVNMMRGGPGSGNIAPAQGDYFQATRGGGHGGYRLISLAPSSGQEMAHLVSAAFDLADMYRMPVLVMGDAILAQALESVDLGKIPPGRAVDKPWITVGAKGRERNVIHPTRFDPASLERFVKNNLLKKYDEISKKEKRWETLLTDDADLVVVAFGTVGRIAKTAVRAARALGLKAGLIRPITLWPFPYEAIADLATQVKQFLVVEMNPGQMVDDVRIAVNGRAPVSFFGRQGGVITYPEEITHQIKVLLGEA